MSEVNKMIKDITNFDDLQKFANTQFTVMTAQAKKIDKLQEEIAKLTIELDKAKTTQVTSSALDTSNGLTNDAETTCLVQLALLKSKSMEGELTLEETKKVETFAKVLHMLKSKEPEDTKNKVALSKFDSADLLTLISNPKAKES